MRVLLIVGAALAGVLLFLLATASAADTTLLARHFPLLLGLNAALAGALAALLGYRSRESCGATGRAPSARD